MKKQYCILLKRAWNTLFTIVGSAAILAPQAHANYIVLKDGESFARFSSLDYLLYGGGGLLLIAIVLCTIYLLSLDKKKQKQWQGDSRGAHSSSAATEPIKEDPVVSKRGKRLILKGHLSSGESVQASIYYSEVEVSPDKRVYIGRDSHLWLPLDDMSVSRLHAQISIDRDQFVVSDKSSGNGTTVGGEKIPTRTFVPIHSGETITFGKVVLYVNII